MRVTAGSNKNLLAPRLRLYNLSIPMAQTHPDLGRRPIACDDDLICWAYHALISVQGLDPTDSDCYSIGSEFPTRHSLFFSKTGARPLLCISREHASLSRVERPRAADERTAPNVKPQHPLGVPRDADPDALADFPLADLAGVAIVARQP